MLPEFRYFSKNFRGKIHNIAKSLFIEKFKDVLRTFRTQLISKLSLRSVQSISELEKKMLEKKYF